MNCFFKYLFILFFTSLIAMPCFADGNKVGKCNALRSCKLQYIGVDDPTAFVVITDNEITEFYQSKKYHIKSDLIWVNDCEYTVIMREVTVPDFLLVPGTIMNVKIDKIENGIVTGIAQVDYIKVPIKFWIMN